MSDWQQAAKNALLQGTAVQINPRGNSMQGRIQEGASVTLHPCKAEDLKIGDVVLADVDGKRFTLTVLHLIMDISEVGFLIGNNMGRIDGWVAPTRIYGKVVAIHK